MERDPNEMSDAEAIASCKDYGREVMGLANPDAKLLEILMEMKEKAATGDLVPEYYSAYRVAFTGFRRLFHG